MLEKNPDICETTGSVNPVVCECNDCGLNDIRGLHVDVYKRQVMLSGQNTAYLMERGLGMLKRVQFVGNHYQIIHSPAEVPEAVSYTHLDVYKRQAPARRSYILC